MKPGYATTEFWLSVAATALTALFASGALTNSTALAIAGMAATVLTALGYKVTRTLVKTAGALLLACLLAAPQLACGGTEQRARNGGSALVGCEAPNIMAAAEQLVPMALQALMSAISNDGKHVDRNVLTAIARPFKDTAFKCALETAVAIVADPTPKPAGPAAAGLEIDAAEVRRAWAAVRVDLGWAR